MIQCTRIWGCWALNASSKPRASCSFGGYWGLGAGLGGRCFLGDTLLLESLFLLIPRTELRGRLIEDKAHGERDFGGHQDEKDEALSPQIATTFFIAQFIEIGQGLGRF